MSTSKYSLLRFKKTLLRFIYAGKLSQTSKYSPLNLRSLKSREHFPFGLFDTITTICPLSTTFTISINLAHFLQLCTFVAYKPFQMSGNKLSMYAYMSVARVDKI